MRTYDYIIIGSGHNGLVAATILAMHDARVAVIDNTGKPGGMAIDWSYAGSTYPRIAYAIGMFPSSLASYLEVDLENNLVWPNPSWIVILDGEVWIKWWLSREKRIAEFKRHGLEKSYREWLELLDAFNKCGNRVLFTASPPPLGELEEQLDKCYRGLGEALSKPWAETIGSLFPPEYWGLFTYPLYFYEPGIITFYFNTNYGLWAYPRNGMDHFIELLEERARKLGVEFYYRTRVSKIVVEDGEAQGVVTASGKTMRAKRGVILSTSIVQLLYLLEPEVQDKYIEKEVLYTLKTYASLDLSATRINFFTREKPSIPSSIESNRPVPIVEYWEDEYWGEAVYVSYAGQWRRGGVHVVTFTGYAPGIPREELATNLGIKSLEGYEEIDRTILLEEYLNPNGHPNHLLFSRDCLLDKRPFPGWGDYTTPIKKLYHGSASSHPGGQITGIPGHNSAIRALLDNNIKPRTPLVRL